MDGFGVLIWRVKEDNEWGEIIEEWEFVVIVFDCLFFLLYFLMFVILLFVFFFIVLILKISLVEL